MTCIDTLCQSGTGSYARLESTLVFSIYQGGICIDLMPKMRQSLLNVTPRSQMMPNFTFPLRKYDSKKRLNRQQVLLRLASTLVKVNDLTPLCQEFSNSAPKIFGVEYTDSTLVYIAYALL